MGCRANVCIKGDDGHVFFYTHWKGDELPQIVAKALERGRSRWGDTYYLRRIIFAEMIADDPSGLTGFGIGVDLADNSYPIVYVDDTKETVGFAAEDTPTSPYCCESYENFVRHPGYQYPAQKASPKP